MGHYTLIWCNLLCVLLSGILILHIFKTLQYITISTVKIYITQIFILPVFSSFLQFGFHLGSYSLSLCYYYSLDLLSANSVFNYPKPLYVIFVNVKL